MSLCVEAIQREWERQTTEENRQTKQSQNLISALKEIKGLRWRMTNGGDLPEVKGRGRVLMAPEATRMTPSVQRPCSERRSAALLGAGCKEGQATRLEVRKADPAPFRKLGLYLPSGTKTTKGSEPVTHGPVPPAHCGYGENGRVPESLVRGLLLTPGSHGGCLDHGGDIGVRRKLMNSGDILEKELADFAGAKVGGLGE